MMQQPIAAAPQRAYSWVVPCLTVGLCLYYYLALFSYSPYDNSFFSAFMPPRPLQNLAGAVGTSLGAYGIYYFGLLAFLLPLPAVSSMIFLQRKNYARLLVTALTSIAAFTVLTMGLRYYQPYVRFSDLAFASEGVAGARLLTAAEALCGWWGSLILSSTILIAVLMPQRFVQAWWVRGWEKIRRFSFPRLPKLPRLSFPKFRNKAALRVEEELLSTQVPARNEDMLSSESAPPPSPENSSCTALHRAEFAEIFPPPLPHYSAWGAEEEQRREQIEGFFNQFKIAGTVIDLRRGPFVTTYVYKPEPGTKQNALIKLASDLALHLQVESIFLHPLHTQSAIGMQIPNRTPTVVHFADLIQHPDFRQFSDPLPLALGVDVDGKPVYESLAHMPHLLLAGSTGSGKSVGLHSFICSLLSKTTPEELKLIFIDPKRLELTFYEGLPYLLRPIITEIDQAQEALTWAIDEMERRYHLLQQAKVRSLEGFNRSLRSMSSKQRSEVCQAAGVKELHCLPYIVIVIDELADLVLQSSAAMSKSVTLLVQKSRACGIHLILATQRPSVDVVTGLIKANLPARISYRLTSSYDSRTILDQLGAEKLLGRGDMLWHKPGAGQLQRLHGAYITDEEIKKLVGLLKGH